MTVITERIEVGTRGNGDIVDLTTSLRDVVSRCGLRDGIATVFVTGSTASLSTIEFEPGAVRDFQQLLDRLAPRDGHYFHHERWGDDNGNSHVRACLMGPSVVVPFTAGEPTLGTWQQLVLLDFDTRPRDRSLVVQLLGE